MSSKRGRKRNDNLPPNRARALEQRVSELEEENACFRQALNLAPSNRPPLGKGPTGKDKARSFDIGSTQALGFHSSHGSSSPDSTGSRGSSQSPSSGITVSMSSRPMTVIEPDSWTETMLLTDHQHHQHHQHHPDIPGPSESHYHLAPMSAPLPQKPFHYPYTNNFSSSSRSLSNNLYSASPVPYNHSSDRPMSTTYGSQSFSSRGEVREESSRPHYSYAQPFSASDSSMHSQSPSPSIHSPSSHNLHNTQRDSPVPFPHRRSLTDPQGFSLGQGFPHLPNPAQLQHNSRPPDYLRQQDGMHLTAPRSGAYTHDGRLHPVP
ncbi:hypothetical protein M413DRAFT_446887 [Hebeloma cylindrosporum]|uniref:Uncharacterized protein n=1 Tax=Hebeloma cylindrosporum TaxID=76867 RepID=A0A0C2YFX5_HEBCY|nr:hypothetical protein M413DRAFT_446887 [Hebeloma cylindrosporum h7]